MNPKLAAAYFFALLALLNSHAHESDTPAKQDETAEEIAYYLPIGYGSKPVAYVSTAAAQVRAAFG